MTSGVILLLHLFIRTNSNRLGCNRLDEFFSPLQFLIRWPLESHMVAQLALTGRLAEMSSLQLRGMPGFRESCAPTQMCRDHLETVETDKGCAFVGVGQLFFIEWDSQQTQVKQGIRKATHSLSFS